MRHPAGASIATMSSFVVVEAQEVLERDLEVALANEAAATKLDAPVLVRDPLPQTFGEAVAQGTPRPRPREADPEVSTGFGEGALDFTSALDEHALQWEWTFPNACNLAEEMHPEALYLVLVASRDFRLVRGVQQERRRQAPWACFVAQRCLDV